MLDHLKKTTVFSLSQWNTHLKTPFCLYSDYLLCVTEKVVNWSSLRCKRTDWHQAGEYELVSLVYCKQTSFIYPMSDCKQLLIWHKWQTTWRIREQKVGFSLVTLTFPTECSRCQSLNAATLFSSCLFFIISTTQQSCVFVGSVAVRVTANKRGAV